LNIKDLYVNIPTEEAINTIKIQLAKNDDLQNTNQIIKLLEIILKQNYKGYPENKFRLRTLPLQRCGHDGAHARRVC